MTEEPTVRGENGHTITLREFIERVSEERWQSHYREHQRDSTAREATENQHRQAHEREHQLTGTALSKAEEAVNRALLAAKEANDKRFDSVNEFRAALGDAASKSASRDSLLALEKSMLERLERGEQASRESLAAVGRSINVLEKSLVERMERAEQNDNRRLIELERNASNFAGRLWALGVVLTIAMFAIGITMRFLPGGG